VRVKSTRVVVEDSGTGQRLEAVVQPVGEDLVIAVGGGERPHVGCVVLAQPMASKTRAGEWSASCSVLTIPPHKEEPIARGVAIRLAETLGRVCVVTAGVHDGDLDADGIAVYLRLGEELAEKLISTLQQSNV
jgi:hypothetical protein